MRVVGLLSLLLVAVAAQAHAATDPQAWVEMAPDGGSLVRVVTTAGACPVLQVDGRATAMMQRAAPADLAPRANKAQVTTPSSFADRVCELPLPRSTRHASLAGQPLALPPAHINRIVVIGDTGCRLKASDNAWQGCDDPAQWPFAAIAARAAALHPDLVLHVGDYLYRENPCPSDRQSCAGSAWGYGEAGWRADFLAPAAPLLTAAPWVMVRGNHEECERAGQGWWRLLDPHRPGAATGCLDAADDMAGNHTDPYAVDLGGGAQLVVADLMQLASAKPGDPAVAATLAADMARIKQLAAGAKDTFVTAHFPINAVLWDKHEPGAVTIGSKPIDGFAPVALPAVRAMLAGHVHMFQVARFTDRPTQVITGFSGTAEDAPLAPATLAEATGKPGAAPLSDVTTIAGRFGYALLVREAHGWHLTAFAADGSTMGEFSL